MKEAVLVSGHEEAVHALQLLLRQHQAVDLLLARAAGDGHAAHQHRAALLLPRLEKPHNNTHRISGSPGVGIMNYGIMFTLTKEEAGNVAKSDGAFAPG